MKADNEPAISLPAYFKRSVKIEICFSIKKKKERKKNQVSDGGNRTPDSFFLSRREVELEYQTMSTWTKNYNKFKVHKKEKV